MKLRQTEMEQLGKILSNVIVPFKISEAVKKNGKLSMKCSCQEGLIYNLKVLE